MRFRTRYLWGCAALLLAPRPAPCQQPAPSTPAGTKTVELLEDLRLLALLNPLELTSDQCARLHSVAATARAGAAAIDAEAKAALERQREPLLAARDLLLQGERTPPAAESGLLSAAQGVEAARAQKTEALLAELARRVHAILTPEQARRIEADLAPTGDQPWRLYARGASGSTSPRPGTARLPGDPGTWVKELRDLRARAARGEAPAAAQAFIRRLTRGVRAGTALFDQTGSQAKSLGEQALALSPTAFARREWALAQAASRIEQEARNQQRLADGKPVEQFDADRWLVEQVLLSPRAVELLQERSKAS